MLTAHEILKQIKKDNIEITPFDIECLNPNSYNVHLSNKLKIYNRSCILDVNKPNMNNYKEIDIPEDGFVLLPNTLYIGATKERISSNKFISAIDGRSSIGRLGIQVHLTAGFGDIGFSGTYTLEITTVQPIRIYPDLKIAQVYFEKPDGKVDFLYNGRYQGQIEPTESRLWKNDTLIKDYHYKNK